MKCSLLLLPLLAVPCVVTSCKDNAEPDTTAAGAEINVDLLYHYLDVIGATDEEKKLLISGFEGTPPDWENIKETYLISNYCTGAAMAGRTELVLQCIEYGADPCFALGGATLGNHMDLVRLVLDKGVNPDNGL